MNAIVDIRDLHVRFTGERTVHALNGVDIALKQGEVLGLLGESGSGKSVTLKALLRMLPANRSEISGTIRVADRDVLALSPTELEDMRGGVVSMIFQEPMLALDPVYTIGDQIAETVARHLGVSFSDGRKRALEMLEAVRIPSARRRLDAYPHEMSGGMRQRAMIALAISCRPKVLLADEPTTALDATVQIQILLLLRELQREFEMGLILITHDLGVVSRVADRVAVMYAGQIVETGTVEAIYDAPLHPYTQGLLACIPVPGKTPRGARLGSIPGIVPSLVGELHGCRFRDRCPYAMPVCAEDVELRPGYGEGHAYRCVLSEEESLAHARGQKVEVEA